MRYLTILLSSYYLLIACETPSSTEHLTMTDRAQQLVNQAIEQHGGDAYDNLTLHYTFRKKAYTLHNQDGQYTYTRSFEEEGKQIVDQLTADNFQRTINGETVTLSDSLSQLYSNSVNSVHYFVQLPYRLNDPAVTKKYIGETVIKGKQHEVVEVTFAEEGGGDDFDDQYYYWLDAETHQLNYLAYSFHVNEGGVRFRAAINPRQVNGVIVQDYLNYKAAKDTPLSDLPHLFENGQLELLSTIETENPQ
jgi:hypothetical protein